MCVSVIFLTREDQEMTVHAVVPVDAGTTLAPLRSSALRNLRCAVVVLLSTASAPKVDYSFEYRLAAGQGVNFIADVTALRCPQSFTLMRLRELFLVSVFFLFRGMSRAS